MLKLRFFAPSPDCDWLFSFLQRQRFQWRERSHRRPTRQIRHGRVHGASELRGFSGVLSVSRGGNDCVDLTTQRLENGTFALMQQKITAGTIKYDGNKAQACFDALGSLTCDGLLQRDQPACLAALDGTVALGGDCDINEECAGSALCQSTTGTCPGKCMALLTAGTACSADGDCAAAGLQCSSETSLCVKPALVGENCEMDRLLQPGLALFGQGRHCQDTRARVATPPTPSALLLEPLRD